MNAPTRICYIHVGAHKTGTTSIQRFLALNRDRFAAAGVLFPAAGCDTAPDYVSHHQLAYELAGSPQFDRRYGGLAVLADELRGSDASVACLSSENFSLLWHDFAALMRLRDVITQAGFTPKVVCYLRPQASFCTSVYAQIVCNGGYRTPFLDYLVETLTTGRDAPVPGIVPPFDYRKLIDPFAVVFGLDAIIVRRYRSSGPDNALLLQFGRLLLSSNDLAGFTFPPVRENGSLDFNTVLTFLGRRQASHVRIRFAPLKVRQVLRFGSRFRRANAGIADYYAVRLPAFELIDLGLATPFRRTVTKIRALASARRALTPPRRIFAPHLARPALLETVIGVMAAAVACASLTYGTRIASTTLVEFGMLSIIVALSAAGLLVRYAAESRAAIADHQFFDQLGARLSVAGYALVGLYALVNALLDVGLGRYQPDPISFPGTIATLAAVLILTSVQLFRKPLLGEASRTSLFAGVRDDRIYLACCYVAMFGQAAHAVVSDWWLDTLIDVLVVVFIVLKVQQIQRSSDPSDARVTA